MWSCGKESTQDAVLQGKGGTGCHRGKEVGELEELGKALLDLPILSWARVWVSSAKHN